MHLDDLHLLLMTLRIYLRPNLATDFMMAL
jgi:hypothetical protein